MSARRQFAARLALRDLNRSLSGLRLLFLCIFLGVATLATIGSLTAAITGELAARGQALLGGDVQVAMSQREASPDELRALRSSGDLSETIRLRAMARPASDPGRAVLTELKGVDAAYPLYGELRVDGRAVSAPPADQIYVAPELASRLGVSTADRLRYGSADFRVAGIIGEEPDRVGEGFTLGPVAIVSTEGLRRTGLIQPGSLFTAKYRLRLPGSGEPVAVIEGLRTQFPSSSWEFRDRNRAAPGADRFFDRLGQFLELIALAALVIAGIGVGNGVASYLRRKQESIATLKVLGATSADIGRVYMLQIGGVALLAALAGMAVGALLPLAAFGLAGDLLPVTPELRLHPSRLLVSGIYGLLIAFIFTLPPLARARFKPAANLFREDVSAGKRIDLRSAMLCAVAAVALVAIVLATAEQPLFSASVLGAIVGVFLLLALIGWLIRLAARRVRAPRRPLLRLAVASLHRPGAQTIPLVVALGLALTLFVSLAAIQSSLNAEIERTLPSEAPNQFILDVPAEQRGEFETILKRTSAEGTVNIVPNLRGTITAFGGQRVADLEELPEDAWFLRGERGLTYSARLPEGSEVVEGSWWPADYRGPPLVSIDREAAEVMGVGVGDALTVSVLGREIEARIASLREIHWDSMGFNYILVFPRSTLEGAPHSLAATVTGNEASEAALTRALVTAFPSVSVIDVGEIIGQVSTILGQMAAAILVAASVAILAGIAVLIGALAASRQARSYDSVIMKTLGATRLQILGAQAVEYGILALILALVSLTLGLTGAWVVIVLLFDFTWQPDWVTVVGTLLGGAGLTLTIALLGSLPLLAARPAKALRAL